MDTLLSLAPFALVGAAFAVLMIRRGTKRRAPGYDPNARRRPDRAERNVGGADDGGMGGDA